MDRTNATRLVLASGVIGGFVVGWTLSRWPSAPPAAPDIAATPPPPAVIAALPAPVETQPGPVSETQPGSVSDAPTTTTAILEMEPGSVSEMQPGSVSDDLPAFSPRTALRHRVARGRVNRGVRKLFGLGPAPRRSGGRAVRYLEDTSGPVTRESVAANTDTATVRTVADAARAENPVPVRMFGTQPTLTTGLVDAFGGRTSGLARFEAPAGHDIDPEKIKPPASRDDGACCLGGTVAECVETTAEACDSAGGVFLGDVTCDQRLLRTTLVDNAGTARLETVPAATCPVVTGMIPAQDAEAPNVRIDPWVTAPDEGACRNTWSFARCPLPAGFFGAGSQAIKTRVCLDGVPLGPVGVPGLAGLVDFDAADTLIRRSADPFDPCHAPSPDPVTVTVAIERMLLEGVEALAVSYDGGDRKELWDFRVEVAAGSAQPEGFLTATKEHPNGGRFDLSLAFCPTLVFTNVDDPRDVRVIDYCAECDPDGIVFESSGIPWVGAIGDTIARPDAVPTAFHPGITDTSVAIDADCNENGFLDGCDIGDGISFDRDGNGVPDECECAADFDGSGDVGFGDLAVLLLEWGPCKDDTCFADLDMNGVVEMGDVFQALRGWGECR